MNNIVKNTIDKFNMISSGDKVLVGVSGGADSVLLLHCLNELKDELGITLEVAHVEHGIRGKDSLDDMEFVKSLCDSNGIPIHILQIDAVNESKKSSMSVEEYSRMKRYDFFDSLSCDKIATAHNLTDNIETIIFRLARGTGLKGVCGIPAVRGNIIRPLIEISSADIRAYCKSCNIQYRIDSTNADSTYSRNNIRNNVLPVLNQLNNDYEGAFLSFINNINEDNDYIEKMSLSAYKEVVNENGIDVVKLKEYDASIIKRVVKDYFSNNGATLDRFHLSQVLLLLDNPSKVQISNTYFAISNAMVLRFANLDKIKQNSIYESNILNISEFDNKSIDFYCDYDRIIGKVHVRPRENGDTISPAGRACTKTLKKLYNELSIPLENREDSIVICDDVGIIGILGYCADDRVKITSDTQRVYTMKISLED